MRYYNPRNAQVLIFAYLADLWVKGFIGVPIAIFLDWFLILLSVRILSRRISQNELVLIIMTFVIFLITAVKLVHGYQVVITSRMPIMFMLFLLLVVDYVNKTHDIQKLITHLKTILGVMVALIVIEGLFINYISNNLYLVNLLHPVGYVNLPNSPFFDSLAQGIIPGAQNASIISCAGIVIYYPFVKYDRTKMNIIFFVLSLFGLMLSVTNTALAALAISIFLYFLITFRFSVIHVFQSLFLIVILLWIKDNWQLWLSMRYDILQNASSSEMYLFLQRNIEIYLSPLASLNRLPVFILLIGIGHSGFTGKEIFEFYDLTSYHADFGYLLMLLEHGVIVIAFFMMLYLYFMYQTGKAIRIMPNSPQKVILVKMVIVVSIFVISGTHYLTITKNGILHMVTIMGVVAFIISRRYYQQYLLPNDNSRG